MEVSKPREINNAAGYSVTNTHNCPIHGNYDVRTLYVIDRAIHSSTQCPKCKVENDKVTAEEAERRARIDAERQRKQKQKALHDAALVPDRYWLASLRSYEAKTTGQKNILKKLTEYAEKWPLRRQYGTSLMLLGLPGTGKTHLACSLIFEVTQQMGSARFTTVADFSRAIRATYSPAAKENEQDVLDRFTNYGFLVIDEVGSSSGSDHEKQALFDLINRRYNAVAPTMLLSNLSLEEVREFLGERIMDRLREGGGKVFVLDWESYRK